MQIKRIKIKRIKIRRIKIKRIKLKRIKIKRIILAVTPTKYLAVSKYYFLYETTYRKLDRHVLDRFEGKNCNEEKYEQLYCGCNSVSNEIPDTYENTSRDDNAVHNGGESRFRKNDVSSSTCSISSYDESVSVGERERGEREGKRGRGREREAVRERKKERKREKEREGERKRGELVM